MLPTNPVSKKKRMGVQKAIQKVSGGATCNFRCTSGSVTEPGMEKIFDCIKQDSATGLESEVLYDIGAHVGFVLFCALMAGFKAATGCEYKENKHLEDVFEGTKAALKSDCPKVEEATVDWTEFTDVPPDTTVVFTFNAVFPKKTQDLVLEKVRDSNAKYFVCFNNKTYLNEAPMLAALGDAFSLLNKLAIRTTGSAAQHIAFIFKRHG